MKAGPELNALIAEKIMEWEWRERIGNKGAIWLFAPDDPLDMKGHSPVGEFQKCARPGFSNEYQLKSALLYKLPHFSEDIAAAWTVLMHLRETQQLYFTVETVYRGFGCRIYHDTDNPFGTALEDTAPLAICLAALKALGIEIPDI